MMIIGCTSYSRPTSPVLRRLASRFIPTAIDNLVDVCSVANISVFFFDTPFHGYYIHGMNPTAKSDTNLKGLVDSIAAESVGSGQRRGLDPDDRENLQTFEIYIPVDLRKAYDKVRAADRDHHGHPKPEHRREAGRQQEEEERPCRQAVEREEPAGRSVQLRPVRSAADRRRRQASHAGEQPLPDRGTCSSARSRSPS